MKITKFIENKLDECLNNIDGWKDIYSSGRRVLGIRKMYGNFTINIYSKECENKYKKVNVEKKRWWEFNKIVNDKYYLKSTFSNGSGWSESLFDELNTNDKRIDNIMEYLTEENEKEDYLRFLPENDQKEFENELKNEVREKKLNRIIN